MLRAVGKLSVTVSRKSAPSPISLAPVVRLRRPDANWRTWKRLRRSEALSQVNNQSATAGSRTLGGGRPTGQGQTVSERETGIGGKGAPPGDLPAVQRPGGGNPPKHLSKRGGEGFSLPGKIALNLAPIACYSASVRARSLLVRRPISPLNGWL